jgi:hypothetical protein
MSWYMKPNERIEVRKTDRAQEAYECLLLHKDALTAIPQRLYLLFFHLLSADELEWLQNKFDLDNGDPRIPEDKRTNLGPVWPDAARRLLRYAIFNHSGRVTEQMDLEYETVIGAESLATASLLTGDPNVTVPLKAMYGIEMSDPGISSTRLGMISKDVWILIGANANKSDGPLPHPSLPRTTDRLEVVYAKTLDPFQSPSSCLMKAVTIKWRSGNKEEPPFYDVGDEISNLNEVILLKHLMLRPEGVLDRKMESFERELHEVISREMRDFIGGPWYLLDNSRDKLF